MYIIMKYALVIFRIICCYFHIVMTYRYMFVFYFGMKYGLFKMLKK